MFFINGNSHMESNRSFFMAFAFLLLLLLAACGQEAPLVETTVQAADTLHFLVPYDSIGVELGDSTLMFGNIWGTAFTPDGMIAVLDKSLGGVRFYTSEGDYISSFIPQGEGPGEFLSIDRLVFSENGSFFLSSMTDRKIALYDSDNNLAREILFDNPHRQGPCRLASHPTGGFVSDNMVMDIEAEAFHTEVGLYIDSNEPDLVYRRRSVPMSENVNARHLTAMKFAVSSGGRVFISDQVWESYQITCFSAQGDSLFVFGLPDYQPVAKSDSLLAYRRERVLEQYINYYGTDEGFNYEPEPCWYPVTSLQIDEDNRIWVRGEQYTEKADIFDENGNFLYSVEFKAPTWQESDSWGVRVSAWGILADPRNPEMYPVVYMLREEMEIVPQQ